MSQGIYYGLVSAIMASWKHDMGVYMVVAKYRILLHPHAP